MVNGVMVNANGAGAVRCDPKSEDGIDYPRYQSEFQGDLQYVSNYVRLVRDFDSESLTYPIVESNTTVCYNDKEVVLSCPKKEESYYGQDGNWVSAEYIYYYDSLDEGYEYSYTDEELGGVVEEYEYGYTDEELGGFVEESEEPIDAVSSNTGMIFGRTITLIGIITVCVAACCIYSKACRKPKQEAKFTPMVPGSNPAQRTVFTPVVPGQQLGLRQPVQRAVFTPVVPGGQLGVRQSVQYPKRQIPQEFYGYPRLIVQEGIPILERQTYRPSLSFHRSDEIFRVG